MAGLTDHAQVCAVAIVLVSDLFLMSHAYLKDSAVTLKAFSIAPVSKASLAIRSALAQARVSARDLQIMEVQGTAASSSNGVDLLKREMAGSRANTSPARIPTVEGLGGLGWAGLCGMGESPAWYTLVLVRNMTNSAWMQSGAYAVGLMKGRPRYSIAFSASQGRKMQAYR